VSSVKKDVFKFLVKRLTNKTGARPEEIPMSISNPLRGTVYDNFQKIIDDSWKRGVTPAGFGGWKLSDPAVKVDASGRGDIKVITRDMVQKTPDGKLKRNAEGNLILKPKAKTPKRKFEKTNVELENELKELRIAYRGTNDPQTRKQLVDKTNIIKKQLKKQTKPKPLSKKEAAAISLENRIQREKIRDEILQNPLATIKRQRVESDDSDIDIDTGMSLDEIHEDYIPSEITSAKSLVGSVSKLSPTTITRSKAVDLKSAKAKELVRLMNKLEEAELKGEDVVKVGIAKKTQYTDKTPSGEYRPIPLKDLEAQISKDIMKVKNKEDREALTKILATKKIARGEPVKVRPITREKRDPATGEVTVTKGITSRDPAKGLDDESQLPNIVGQASDPTSPVIKLDVRADPGFPSKTDQEFFDNRVQDYLDQGDDFKTARKKASDDIQERNLSEFTVEQLRDKMGKGSVDSPIRMDDTKPSRSVDYGQPRSDTEGLATLVIDKLGDIRGAEYKVNKKKAGGQVGKPKRKIKKSVRGNDLVAMMYD